MKCFYHSADLDGICSAAIVNLYHPECELFPINYGNTFYWDSIKQGETVYMVDFSLQPFGDMLRLNDMCDLIWIDHHKSAIEEREASGISFKGVQQSGMGACALVNDYFARKASENSDITISRPVMLLAAYDVWDHKDSRTVPFQYGIRMEDCSKNPRHPKWEELIGGSEGSYFDDIVARGETIMKYVENDNRVKASALCFDHVLPWGPGLKCLAANAGPCNSQLFESRWNPTKYEAMMLFSWRKYRWAITLFTDRSDIDVSEPAKWFGGGGHRGAAGFNVPSLSLVGLPDSNGETR